MARTRTYAELETAMFDQSELVWRYLSGLDPTARQEFVLTGEVVNYWQDRWRAELRPEESALADGVAGIQRQIVAVSDSVFRLADAGRREEGYRLAQRELKGRLQPALTQMNREIYRRARESSVRGAYSRLEEILADEGRTLTVIIALALVAGLIGSWLISRSLARPVSQLTQAMAVVGAGDLDHPIEATSRDEIGDLARALARDDRPASRDSREQLVQAGEAGLDRRDVGGGGARASESAGEPPRRRAARPPPSHLARRPPSTSTPSSRRWTAWTAASATCSASAGPRPFTPCPRACRG